MKLDDLIEGLEMKRQELGGEIEVMGRDVLGAIKPAPRIVTTKIGILIDALDNDPLPQRCGACGFEEGHSEWCRNREG